MIRPEISDLTIGGLAAIGSAATFAFCAILLQQLSTALSPLGANFFKSSLGALILFITMLCVGIENMSIETIGFLCLSGFLGIALADTFFFKALVLLGPRLTLLLETLSPVFTLLLAIILLKEHLTPASVAGIILILSGVAWVLWERTSAQPHGKKWKKGIFYALSFSFCMSTGIILTKIAVKDSSALQATFIRLFSASIILFSYGILTKNLVNWSKPLRDPKVIKIGTTALVLAIFGGFWLSTVALKYIDASIATVLNSTTPLFILPMVAVLKKERVSLQATLGAIVALVGIAFIFLF